MTEIIFVEVKNSIYYIKGKKYLNRKYQTGTYAAYTTDDYTYKLIPASKEEVEEYMERFANDKRIDYVDLDILCFNNKKFNIEYFENIIKQTEQAKIDHYKNRQAFEDCIKNATEVTYEIIEEGVYQDYVSDTIRSCDVVYQDYYPYFVLQTNVDKKITITTDRIEKYNGDFVDRLPYKEALVRHNNEEELGTMDKYFITYNGKKYYFNK